MWWVAAVGMVIADVQRGKNNEQCACKRQLHVSMVGACIHLCGIVVRMRWQCRRKARCCSGVCVLALWVGLL